MDQELIEYIPHDENVERTEIIGHLPRGDEFKHVQRDARNSIQYGTADYVGQTI